MTNRELGSVIIKQPEHDLFVSTLVRMIEIGPREVKYDGNHLLEIIEKVEEIFVSEPTLLDVPVPCQETSTVNTRICFAGFTSTVSLFRTLI